MTRIKHYPFLPAVLVFLSGNHRYKPGIVWSPNSWTHNLFRLYECLFWRRVGIRPESSCAVTVEDGRITEIRSEFYSIEALLAYAEHLIRNLFKIEFATVRIKILRVALPAGTFLPFFSLAIAFDASANASSVDWTQTLTGSNVIVVWMLGVTGNTATPTMQLNGTTIGSNGHASDAITNTLWVYTSSVATGAAVIGSNTFHEQTGVLFFRSVSMSYSGCDDVTANGIDSIGTFQTGGSPETASTTVVAANCWLIGFSLTQENPGQTPSTTSNRTDRNNNTTGQAEGLGSDSNGTVATGSQSIVFTDSGASPRTMISVALSIAPVVSSTPQIMAGLQQPTNRPIFEQIGVVPY